MSHTSRLAGSCLDRDLGRRQFRIRTHMRYDVLRLSSTALNVIEVEWSEEVRYRLFRPVYTPIRKQTKYAPAIISS